MRHVFSQFQLRIHHEDLKMTWFKDEILWTLKDFEVHGGNYEKGTWVHLAMVFDGTDRTISTYNNGELVITVQVDPMPFLDKCSLSPMVFRY